MPGIVGLFSSPIEITASATGCGRNLVIKAICDNLYKNPVLLVRYNNGMVVYVEYLLLDNGLVDCLVAYLVLWLSKKRCARWRIALSAVLGTALVFGYLYIKPTWAQVLYKIATLLLVCLPLANSCKHYAACCMLYATFSALLGGLVYLVFGNGFSVGLVLTKPGGVVGALAGAMLLVVYIARQLVGLVRTRTHRQNIVEVDVTIDGRVYRLKGFCDTGNTATATDGRGVAVLSSQYKKLLRGCPVTDTMRLSTVSGACVVSVVQIPSVKIYFADKSNTIVNVNACVGKARFVGYDVLLPEAL